MVTMGHVITTPEHQGGGGGKGPNTVVQTTPGQQHQQPHQQKQQHQQQHQQQQKHNQHQQQQQQQQKHYQQQIQQKPTKRHSLQPASPDVTLRSPRTAPCRRTQSVYLDPNSPKGQLALLERSLQGVIEKLGAYQPTGGRTDRADVRESVSRILHILRQRMRLLRRWRNGSAPYNEADLEEFSEFLTNTRIDVFAIEVQCIEDDLSRVDEYILILDDGSNDLRQNVDDDFQSVLNDLAKFQLTDALTSGKFADDMEGRLADLTDAVLFLRKKISDQADPPAGSGGGRTPSATSPVEDPLDRFETNPSRNRVLATADRVRRMLRAFTECSGHVDLGGMAKTEMCMENDSEVLRRQLRKIRRWQHNAQRFDSEDVDDLQLIISAIERHLKPSHACSTPSPRPASDGQFTPASSRPRGVNRSVSQDSGGVVSGPLSTSVVSLSLESADLTTDSGVADTDPPSDDMFRDGASSTKDGFTDISELEEDEDFSERLI